MMKEWEYILVSNKIALSYALQFLSKVDTSQLSAQNEKEFKKARKVIALIESGQFIALESTEFSIKEQDQ